MKLTSYGHKVVQSLSSSKIKPSPQRFYSKEETRSLYQVGHLGGEIDQTKIKTQLTDKGLINTSVSPQVWREVETAVYIPTYQCNLHCHYCYHKPDNKNLTIQEIKSTAEVLKAMGISSFLIHGGEPTLRKDLPKIVESLSEGGLYSVSMVTNGRTNAKNYWPQLIEKGLSSLVISIDGKQEDHDRQRGRGSFVQAVKTFQEAKPYFLQGKLDLGVNATPLLLSDEEQIREELEEHLGELSSAQSDDTTPHIYVQRSIFQTGKAARLPTRGKGTSFSELRDLSEVIEPSAILIRPNGGLGHNWLDYGYRGLGYLDRTDPNSVKKSLINCLNSFHLTPEYQLAKKGNVQDAVKFVDKNKFPKRFENQDTPLAITLAIWDKMHKLSSECNLDLDHPEVVEVANWVVAKKYGFSCNP